MMKSGEGKLFVRRCNSLSHFVLGIGPLSRLVRTVSARAAGANRPYMTGLSLTVKQVA
jgi:hypothetical protein